MDSPHRRLNPLTGEWILVSPHRTRRPWQGKQESLPPPHIPSFDPECYLCPGNPRANGGRNPVYEGTFVFPNDYAALVPDTPAISGSLHPLMRFEGVQGSCRVVCYSPRHDLTLAELDTAEIEAVVKTWADETAALGQRFRWVQVFENKGEMMGCSNPHPHGQIWAGSSLPAVPQKEDERQAAFLVESAKVLLEEYLLFELENKERLVCENAHWAVVVPYWAVWPFEVLLLPRRHILRLPDLTAGERASLASILKRILVRLDNVFQVSFPYTMGWHGAPYQPGPLEHWQLHAHVYPPLLRSATVRKFMVGYEMLAESQRDITPEHAAEVLRQQSEEHFRRNAV